VSVPSWQSVRDFLRLAGVDPESDPTRYDLLARDAERWFARGGSMRSFVAAVKAGQDTRTLTTTEARRICERRYRVPL
jgi:hypothetical protein